MEDPGGSILPQLIFIVILTAINAFFAAAEMAIVSANRNKIEQLAEEGNKKALTLLRITDDQTRFLSTIQVGITLAGFFSAGSAASGISTELGAWIGSYGVLYGRTIAFVLVTFLLSFLTLVFGELVPKRIALQNAEATALKSAPMIKLFSKLTKPFVFLLSVSTTLVLKALGKYSEDVEEKISEEELRSYLQVGQQQGVINASGQEMMVNIMAFDDKLAYEIMTPRTSIYMLDYEEFSPEIIEEMLNEGYSRAPVYRDNTDNIVGTVYIKDIFVEYAKTKYQRIDIDAVLKKPYFVPETKNIDQLLQELQASKNYVAILIDEYGGFSGMVTIEDIVEEIVGEIEDEYDDEIIPIQEIAPNTYIVDGYMDIDDINSELDINLYSENHETISGLMIELLGFIPEENQPKREKIYATNNVCLTEMGVRDKRITSVEIKIFDPEISEE
ncbi:hemolysin family protein [Peptoniphilus sp. KCTC 25270]|uniref:hemolysin family protein n=1 Tax=Peptoniphilus sp. KCTC 25270 TaxID=2897414 RepID=UPI001E5567C6|nr:hemolysin family protein [Peptoniphilus sp. KCTC 25270]MCD1146502.1 hemolysin family protein [Peptoniphilus sp. KCTC 25270]